MKIWAIISLLSAVLASPATIAEDKPPRMGKLGYAVGTELTIDGTFKGGKNSWLLVIKVNGQDLAEPRLVPTCNIDPFAKIPENTVCRFRGIEVTYLVKSVFDPKTGEEMQQARPGRHFGFKILEVIAPVGVKIRRDRKSEHPDAP